MKIFIFFLLACLAFANPPLTQQAKNKKLWLDPNWKSLLHFKHGKSEIDDERFFLSHKKDNLKQELLATLQAMLEDKTDDDNSTSCMFPARKYFLQKHLGILPNQKKCKRLHKELDALSLGNFYISFPTAHINSPASMFGHTLLRINSDDNLSLISNAVNYSAITNETNGFLFAFNGIFGGYKGRYSIDAYYKKIQEYAGVENRDIWEYELDLDVEERRRATLEIIEISRFYSDYFFFSENCSYNLLWILTFAKNSKYNLIKNFNYTATPIETIKELEKYNLIRSRKFRASNTRLIQAILKSSKDPQKIMHYIKSNYDNAILKQMSKTEQTRALDVATKDLQSRYIKGEIDKTTYTKNFIPLLSKRSKLSKLKYDIKTPDDVLLGHGAHRFMLDLGDEKYSLSYRPTYHDLYDMNKGFANAGYINFFDTTITHEDGETRIDKFMPIDIRSYAKRDLYHKPISWEVQAGLLRRQDLFFHLQAGAGLSYGGEHYLFYAMILPFLNMQEHRTDLGIGLKTGLNINLEHYTIGGFYHPQIDTEKQDYFHAQAYIIRYINKSLNIGAKYDRTKYAQDDYKLSLMWKF